VAKTPRKAWLHDVLLADVLYCAAEGAGSVILETREGCILRARSELKYKGRILI
jgi:hypothetical protein